MKSGLLTGRFQPFHLGHLSAVRQALEDVETLSVAIGSSQYSHQSNNPFSGEERKEMVEAVLREEGLANRCRVLLVPDIHDDDKWCAHVREIVPAFDIIFVGNDGLVKELFEKEGKSPVKMVRHELNISATRIREALRKGEDIRKWIPEATMAYLESHNGADRIRSA